ncbi:hypothetical protein J2R76_001865 [Bradyrhizobium sp. USDA 4532]|uniref:hypothetical protein n=1 Tax=Bradyrhizobium TaxID=374 RepID=UPI00117848CC|nr:MULTISPECIES: hypothetical protein [Bradyrhizobium]MCP1833530.1 hypothetical protein [Bradyrhizobium sp. USDA 4545]MCP1852454.1 hypothetical protein [Bradyrhizobium sp. USDA 4541]MCP1918274.1 hypothetical protein [Bradyrhizobium sp. USDA 4532]
MSREVFNSFSVTLLPLKSLVFSAECFVDRWSTKQFEFRRNHFRLVPQNSGNGRSLSDRHTTAPDAERNNGDCQMRTMSLILALAFVMAGSSMAGSPDSGLPGIGTFSYNGSPVVTPAPMVLAQAN